MVRSSAVYSVYYPRYRLSSVNHFNELRIIFVSTHKQLKRVDKHWITVRYLHIIKKTAAWALSWLECDLDKNYPILVSHQHDIKNIFM